MSQKVFFYRCPYVSQEITFNQKFKIAVVKFILYNPPTILLVLGGIVFMESFLSNLTKTISDVNRFIWGPYFLISLLCGTGLFFTIRLRGVQFSKFGTGFKQLVSSFSFTGKKAGKHGMSSFQALATAIAAQVGTGSLVGAVTAIIMGGPGAIFWVWVVSIAGMATTFVEASIAQVYKTKDASGQTVGGPAYYISKGLSNTKLAKLLSVVFAILAILTFGFMGSMVQANSISDAFKTAFNIPPLVTGIGLALLSAIIFIGGIKRIAFVTEKMVPLMALAYVIIGVLIILMNASHIPAMFAVIFKGAFNPRSVWGGSLAFGMARAARYGIARGLFASEAGMGSTPHAHAIAEAEHPAEQGFLAIIAVFITSFIVLNITVFAVLSSDVIRFERGEAVMQGIQLVQEAFSSHLLGRTFGYVFIAVCLFFFAFSTIIGWYYFSEMNVRFLFSHQILTLYRIIVAFFVFLGSVVKLELVWELTDLFTGIIAIPNLIGLLALSNVAVNLLQDYDNGKPFDVSV